MGFWEQVQATLRGWLLDGGPVHWLEVGLAAAMVYVFAIAIVRIGKKRFLGRNTVFDAILGFMLGSTLARAINGGASLGPTVVAGLVLVMMHWVFGLVSHHDSRLGRLVKGGTDVVVRDGKVDEDVLRRHHLSLRDIEEAMHVRGKLDDVQDIRIARFERNGQISIVPGSPKVISIDVEDGVQKVEVRMG